VVSRYNRKSQNAIKKIIGQLSKNDKKSISPDKNNLIIVVHNYYYVENENSLDFHIGEVENLYNDLEVKGSWLPITEKLHDSTYTYYTSKYTNHIFMVRHPFKDQDNMTDDERWAYKNNMGAVHTIKKLLSFVKPVTIDLVDTIRKYALKNLDKYVSNFNKEMHDIVVTDYEGGMYLWLQEKEKKIDDLDDLDSISYFNKNIDETFSIDHLRHNGFKIKELDFTELGDMIVEGDKKK